MNSTVAWGTYAPGAAAWALQFLTRTGLIHGKSTHAVNRLWRKLHGDQVDVSVRSIKYRLNLSDNITDIKILCSSKEYDKLEVETLKQACKGEVFIDIGYYSLAVASAGATKVLAIEPNPTTLSRLQYNIEINGLDKIIQTVPVGIGNAGEAEFFFSSQDLGGASMLGEALGKTQRITIQTMPLLDIVKQHGVDQIGGIKIDVEGMEDRALLPFFKSAPESLWPRFIVLEHCHQADWQTDIIDYLEQQRYETLNKTRANTIFKLDGSYK
jgi:FkbM family methyltransferase